MTRTIDKILLAKKLTSSQKQYYFEKWIINWCGWKDWFSFDSLMDNIKSFKWFDLEKLQALKDDIREICYIHDLDFYEKNWFYKSNFLFAYRLARLLTFTWFFERLLIFIVAFLLLNKYWKKYYK